MRSNPAARGLARRRDGMPRTGRPTGGRVSEALDRRLPAVAAMILRPGVGGSGFHSINYW
jgi:hypothetical protein